MIVKTNTRLPKGDVPDPCPKCETAIVGGRASRRYQQEATFVHVYEDAECTRWLTTLVYHEECWKKVGTKVLKKQLIAA